MTREEEKKKELDAWKERKMNEAKAIRKEFPALPAGYIYATYITCRFNPDETRKALKSKESL